MNEIKEEFKVCDAKNFKTSKGDIVYYLVVYSTYEFVQRVYVSKAVYEQYLSGRVSNDRFTRVYNRAKNAFVIIYTDKKEG